MGPLRKILVVEDSPSHREELVRVLSEAGYAVATAASGAEAVRKLRADPPDLVLLDKVLPDMDGLEVLRHAKLRPEEFVPVILVSARSEVHVRVDALRVGADDFLVKPYEQTEILARVGAMLRIKALQDQVREQKRRLEELSVTDGLTGLANHRHFQEELRREFSRAQRYSDPLSLIMMDLDHFKTVNDRYGHPFGDRVLKETADLLRRRVRDADLPARYGGEEFAVILPKTTATGAFTVAERVHADLNGHVFREEERPQERSAEGSRASASGPIAVRVTASFGVASYPSRDVTSPDLLIRFADEALYRAKSERNAVCVYQSQAMRGDAGRR